MNKKEGRILLTKETNCILDLSKDNNLYSAMDLILLKTIENRDKSVFLEEMKRSNPNINDIRLYAADNKVYIRLYVKYHDVIKELMLTFNPGKSKIEFQPICHTKDVENIIWSPHVADELIDENRLLIYELIRYGMNNLVGNEYGIKTNSSYLEIDYNLYLNHILSVVDNLQCDLKFKNLYLLNYNISFKPKELGQLEIEVAGDEKKYFKKILNSENKETTRRFLENLQFSEDNISNNLNKQLSKKLSR